MTLTRHDRVLLNPLIFGAFYSLRFIGMRDRLRCPECRAVGTWKPHWPVKPHAPRRWLCKWCGHYISPLGRLKAYPSTELKVWALEGEAEPTPREVLREHMGKVSPWVG